MGLKIYSAYLNVCDDYSAQITNVLKGVEADTVCGILFCGTSTSQYHSLLDNLRGVVCDVLNKRVPVTLIPQHILPNGGLAVEVYTLDNATIRFEEREGVCYGLIGGDEGRMLFVEGIPATDFTEGVQRQSDEVFGKLDRILASYDFEVDDIVRQWNYIGSIVACREGKQNYQEFNDARSRYYGKCEWRNGYPAATGIGSAEGIIVGGIAFKKAEGGIYPIDNPLQIAAHVYSKSVLIDDDKNAVKSTPKFERAKLIETERGACCFVSGTAAIRGEASVDAENAGMQTVCTLENIEYLVSAENLVRFGCKPYDLKCVKLHVFIKHADDYEAVRRVVEERYPNVATIYSVADVCRSELLVEIEGILIS